MCKFCWSTVIILALVTVGMAYKFIIQGEVIEEPDSRTAILLTSKERDLVLFEMRVFLQSVQQVTSGISADDMGLVASAARQSGRNAQIAVPGTLIGKLPIAFKKLGFDTHAKFDELALDAEQLGDGEHTITQLSALLENCVSCHSVFKFNIE